MPGRLAWVAFGCVLVALALPSSAAAERDYTVRFSKNFQGDITGTGNTLMTCRDSDSQCAAARNGTAGGGENNNNSRPMQYVDVDGVSSTFNSSAATLVLPAGARIEFAGLYYTGHQQAGGSGGAPAPDITARNRVLFRTPGAGGYVPLTAEIIDEAGQESDGSPREYQGFVDVTDIVKASGAGEYMVANVQLGTGLDDDMAGGWALAVAYEDTTLPTRNLTIFDGFRFVLADGPAVTIPLSGFLTPKSGPVTSSVGLVAIEGDLGTTGDSATLNGRVLTNATNPSNNFFNASISDRTGTPFTQRRPAYSNQLGFDADIFDATGFLTNNQTSTTLVLDTSGDGFVTDGVSFATDLFAPSLNVPKTVDKAQANLGDELTYTLSVTNTGLDAAIHTSLHDSIPEGTSYVPGSLEIDGAGKTDGAEDDQAEYDPAGDAVVFRIGAGADGSEGGRLGVNATTTVRFKVRIDAGGLPVGTEIVNSADVGYIAETLNLPGTVNSPEVVTTVPVPDLAIDKSHEGAFEPGARVPFELAVRNVGDGPALGRTTVTDELPDELRFADRPAGRPQGEGWDCATSGQTLTCTRDDELAPDASWPPISFEAVVRQNADPGDLVNTAEVSNAGDGNELNDTDTDPGSVAPARPDLAIDKETLTLRAFPGEKVRFRLRVTNLRPPRATRVRVRDIFPAGLTPLSLVPSKGSCRQRSCRLGRVRHREVVTIEVTALAGLDTGGQTLRNVARVGGRERDLNPANNVDSDVVPIDELVDIVVTKSAAASTVPAGSDVSFVVVVRNDGPSDASRVTLRDLLPAGLTPVSLTPSKGRCTFPTCSLGRLRRGASAQIVIVARSDPALAGQTVVNRAAARAAEPEQNFANNLGLAPVTFTAAPLVPAEIVVSKVPDRQQVTVGDELTYRITVENRGPGDAPAVRVTETPDAAVEVVAVNPSQGTCVSGNPITCDLGPLAAGARATITLRVKVLAPGPLRNAVTAIAPTTDPTPGGEIETAGVSATNVSLRKRASRSTVREGQTVTFTMTASAEGNAPAEDVEVCDRLPSPFRPVSLGGGRVRDGRVCWRVPHLDGGQTRTFRLVARSTAARPTRVTNTARITAAGQRAQVARARVRILPRLRPPPVTG